jgi:hypothetical protein
MITDHAVRKDRQPCETFVIRQSKQAHTIRYGKDYKAGGSHLEVDDNQEDDDCCEQVGDVRHVVPVEGILQRPHLPRPQIQTRRFALPHDTFFIEGNGQSHPFRYLR